MKEDCRPPPERWSSEGLRRGERGRGAAAEVGRPGAAEVGGSGAEVEAGRGGGTGAAFAEAVAKTRRKTGCKYSGGAALT